MATWQMIIFERAQIDRHAVLRIRNRDDEVMAITQTGKEKAL